MKRLVLTRKHKVLKSALDEGKRVKVDDVDSGVLKDFIEHRLAMVNGNQVVPV